VRTPLAVALDLEWDDLGLEAAALSHAGTRLVRLDQLQDSQSGDVVALLTEASGLTGEQMRRYPNLKVISVLATGYEGIDLDAARELGIAVANVAGYCTEEVADHTLALALSMARKLEPLRRRARSGNWSTVDIGPVARFADSTWGVIGFGRIGRAVARRAAAFGFAICAYDPKLDPCEIAAQGARPLELEPLLHEADIVSVHAARTGRADRMLDRRRLSLLKPSAYLVNVARGAFIDEDALADALDAGKLAGAALDVLSEEPPDPSNRLLQHPRALVTPHAAWYSDRAEAELRARGIAAVIDALSGRQPADLVAELR
jgi:D-3-phosphoglycerate dehydrogenase